MAVAVAEHTNTEIIFPGSPARPHPLFPAPWRPAGAEGAAGGAGGEHQTWPLQDQIIPISSSRQ